MNTVISAMLILNSLLCLLLLAVLWRQMQVTRRWRADAQESSKKASQWRLITKLADVFEFRELPDGDYQRERLIARFDDSTLWIINKIEPLGPRHEIKVLIPIDLVWDKCFTVENGQISEYRFPANEKT
ncbi:MAG: hypothetical protein AAB925_00485 [Patescibacteria group bacterium]